MNAKRFILCLAALLFSDPARADIYRWDTGEVIPGTEGIEPGPGVQLNNWNTEDHNLRYADFSGFDVSNASFEGSWLDNASFVTADLTAAHLARTRLTDAFFLWARLSNATLASATVNGSSFAATDITKQQLYSTRSYEVKDLRGIGLGSNDLTGWSFSGVDLTGASFSWLAGGATIAGADFSDAVITAADLSGTHISKEQLYSTASYKRKDLREVRFGVAADLRGWNLDDQDLSGSEFFNCIGGCAGHADFTSASLVRAKLTRARLHEAILVDTNLEFANLTNASLDKATFVGANLTATDLRGAAYADLSGATTENTILPDGTVAPLHLSADAEFWVRDYDGDPYQQVPPLPIVVRDAAAFAVSATLRMIFEADPWDSTVSFEPDISVELGGTLALTFTDDVDVSTQIGRTFHVFDWTGVEPIGAFDVDSQYVWDTSQLYITGGVSLTAVPEPTSLALAGLVLFPVLASIRQRARQQRSQLP